jgi:hypothetical protein
VALLHHVAAIVKKVLKSCKDLDMSKNILIFAASKKLKQLSNMKVEIENYGFVNVENDGDGLYSVTDMDGNYLGQINSEQIEDWDDSDPIILSSIIEDLMDDGTLDCPTMATEED